MDKSRKTWKETQFEQRATEILRVSTRMFAEQGFHDTNLNDVAKEVGIARGTIYLHFATKEDLLAAIVDDAEKKLLASMQQAIATLTQPMDKLKAVFLEYLKIYKEYRDIIKVLSSDHRGLVTSRLYGVQKLPPVPAMIHQIIDQGKAIGAFALQINTHIAVNAFFGMVTMESYQDIMANGVMSHEELVESVLLLYFGGIRGQDGEK